LHKKAKAKAEAEAEEMGFPRFIEKYSIE